LPAAQALLARAQEDSMHFRRIALRLALVPLVVVVASMAGSIVGLAQAPSGQPDVMSALLTEVRGLRAAMEQMAAAGPRVQLLLGRVQLQEQRIANQVRRLDTVRAALVPAQRELDEAARHLKDLQIPPEQPCDPNSPCQSARDWELKETKRVLGLKQAELQRLLAEEGYLVQDIATEQARWNDFNQRLEDLDRTLSRRSAADRIPHP
jgi:hypothetical protein